MPRLVGLVVLLFVLAFAGRARADSTAATLVKEGTAARAAHDLPAARAAFEGAAAAAGDPRASAEALFLLADMDEGAGEYARALERYRASAARAPESRFAPRATTRADWLRARSEGSFAPLARLEEVRRSPEAADDPDAIQQLAVDLESFPPGLVRLEARMVVAEAYAGRFQRPADAVAQYRAVMADPKVDPITAHQAGRALVEALIAGGDEDQAARDAVALEKSLDAKLVSQVRRAARRPVLRKVAVGELLLVVLGTSWSLVAALREARGPKVVAALTRSGPLAILFAAYLAIAGGWLASSYETGTAKPFLSFGLALLPVLLLARTWSAAGSPAPWARATRAVLCALASFAAAFLIMDRLDPIYLEGFGL